MAKKIIINEKQAKELVVEHLDNEFGMPLYNYLKQGNRNAPHEYNGKLLDGDALVPLFLHYMINKADDEQWKNFYALCSREPSFKNRLFCGTTPSGRRCVYCYEDYPDGKMRPEEFFKKHKEELYRIFGFGSFYSLWVKFTMWYLKESDAGDFQMHGMGDSNVVLYNPKVTQVKWLIHFTGSEEDAMNIANVGFRRGVPKSMMDKLAYTTNGELSDEDKDKGDYSYAYDAEDVINDGFLYNKYINWKIKPYDNIFDMKAWDYGKRNAVMFQANGVKVSHMTDQEEQVIFPNNTARNFVVLKQVLRPRDNEDYWMVVGKDGRRLYSNRSLTEVVKWVVTNYRQYSKVLQESRSLNEGCKYDLSEIGEIECSLDFDEDYYEEYLTDNGLSDSPQARLSFIRDCDIEYDVELKDPEIYHTFDYERMTINDIEESFGSAIANDVLNDCMDGRSHRYEPLAYDNETVDITNPDALSNAAMQRLKSGEYTKNCRGFILPNGVVVYTGSEHNMCTQIPGVNGTYHFIELGCIRVLDHSIDIAQVPTPKQMQTLQQVFDAYYGDTLYLDLMNKKIGQASKQYRELYPEDAFRDINNYFSYGIKPKQGIYENIDELDLYHGTNADFNQFSEDFFLSGVGEMAMGWGVYLTNSLNTAKAYSPGGQVMTVQVPDGKYLDGKRIGTKEAMDIALKFKKYFLSTEYGKSAYGNCEDEFWEYECSAIAKCPDGSYLYGTVATLLGNDKEASRWLHSIGYVGLRFYSTNVNTKEKSINYVIFDVNDVKIINKQKTNSLNENVNVVRKITKHDIFNRTMSVIERRNGVELSDNGKKWFIGLMQGSKFGITMDMILEKAAFNILNIPAFPLGQSVGNEWDELDGILRVVIQKTGLGNDILQRLRALKWGEDRKIISDGEWIALETALQYYPDILKELKRCYGNFAVVAPVIYKAVDYLKRYKDGTAALEFCYLVGCQREHTRAALGVAVDQVLHGIGSRLLPQITSNK